MHIVDEKQSKALAAGLALTYVVGAARQDADAQHKGIALRAAVMPVLAQFKKDGQARPVVEAIQSVLGQDWEPTGEWAAAIENLLLPAQKE